MLNQYVEIIRLMPIEKHGFKTSRIIWKESEKNYSWLSDYNDKIFQGNKYRTITRRELLDFFSENKGTDIRLFILLVIYWGYPSGMRNKYFDEILENIKTLEKIIEEIRETPNIENFLKYYTDRIKGFGGLGLSTFSKFLYFLKSKIEGEKAVILDLRIIDVLRNSIFKDKIFEKLRYENAPKNYPFYLKNMREKASQLNNISIATEKITSEKIEMFLFIFGNILQD